MNNSKFKQYILVGIIKWLFYTLTLSTIRSQQLTRCIANNANTIACYLV